MIPGVPHPEYWCVAGAALLLGLLCSLGLFDHFDKEP